MPVHTVNFGNPNGGSGYGDQLSALLTALAPNPAREANRAAVGADLALKGAQTARQEQALMLDKNQSVADVFAANALGASRNAQAGNYRAQTADQLAATGSRQSLVDAILAGTPEGGTPLDVARLGMAHSLGAGVDVDPAMLAAVSGASPDDLGSLLVAGGTKYEDTKAAYDNRPMEVYDPETGRVVMLPQGDWQTQHPTGAPVAPVMADYDQQNREVAANNLSRENIAAANNVASMSELTTQIASDETLATQGHNASMNELVRQLDSDEGVALANNDASYQEAVAVQQLKGDQAADAVALEAANAPAGNPNSLQGTGAEQQYVNIVRDNGPLLQSGTATPEQTVNYQHALIALYGPQQHVANTDRGDVIWNEYKDVPPGVYVPPNLQSVLFENGAAPAVAANVAASGPVAPGVAPGVTPAAATAPAPISPPAATGTPNIIPGTEPKPGPKTEAQARYYVYSQRGEQGAAELYSSLGFDPVTGTLKPNNGEYFRPTTGQHLAAQHLPAAVKNLALNPEAQAFYTAAAQSLNPILRADSGAAVPEGEYPRYFDQFIPLPHEDDRTTELKLRNLQLTIEAFKVVSGQLEYAGLDVDNDDDLPAIQQLMEQTKSDLRQQGSPEPQGGGGLVLPEGFTWE